MTSMEQAAPPQHAGVPKEVAVAAAATAVGAVPLIPAFTLDSVPTGALYLMGWPTLGIVAAVLLDRRPDSRIGRTLVVLALAPAALAVAAFASGGGTHTLWDRVESIARNGDVLIVLLALVALSWAVGMAPDRMSRRRLVWVTVWSAALVAAVAVASLATASRTLGLVTALGLCGLAAVLLRLETASEFRPVDEPLVDIGAVLGAVLVGAGAGVATRVAAERAGLPLQEVSAGFAAVLATALAWPAVLWLRRALLERRYGTGTLPPDAVAAITHDLRPDSDPRELLARAATMTAVACGHDEVRLVLGPDDPELPDAWQAHPLVVGGERVGTMLVHPRHAQGPEPRQDRLVAQLVPTVALMTRAVQLAVTADQSRRDIDREREAERSRILGDLHDGLGPALAGMSMRVQAELRRVPTPLLTTIAGELADAREDLRQVVSDLTPSALHGVRLAEALEHLVATLTDGRSTVVLDVGLGSEPCPETAVAVYRSVAEGVTNALRHGRAERVQVVVRSAASGEVVVEIVDDGDGGPVVPGIGLTSLRRRAERLGGRLEITPREPRGIRLHVSLPVETAA